MDWKGKGKAVDAIEYGHGPAVAAAGDRRSIARQAYAGSQGEAKRTAMPSPRPASPAGAVIGGAAAAAGPTAVPAESQSKRDSDARPLQQNIRLRVQQRKRQFAGAGVGNVAEGCECCYDCALSWIGLTPCTDPACNDVGNNVLSCFPLGSTELVQDQWSKFIWVGIAPSKLLRAEY